VETPKVLGGFGGGGSRTRVQRKIKSKSFTSLASLLSQTGKVSRL